MVLIHGVTVHPAPWDMTALDAFEANARKRAGIVSYFIGAPALPAFNTHSPERDRLVAIQARGAVPMISWQWMQLSNLADITAGGYDAGVRLWAQELKAHGGPVLLRWGHEMNLPNYPWSVGVSGNTATHYIEAWRRIRGLFWSEGATNVLFVWSPNIRTGPAIEFTHLYPGDRYVDWIALDGYNWSHNPWRSFTQIFRDSYDSITELTTTKPLMLAEWGCTDKGAGDKGDWLRSALRTEMPLFPRINAQVYFNQQYDNEDWRIESSPAAAAGYAEGVGYEAEQAEPAERLALIRWVGVA